MPPPGASHPNSEPLASTAQHFLPFISCAIVGEEARERGQRAGAESKMATRGGAEEMLRVCLVRTFSVRESSCRHGVSFVRMSNPALAQSRPVRGGRGGVPSQPRSLIIAWVEGRNRSSKNSKDHLLHSPPGGPSAIILQCRHPCAPIHTTHRKPKGQS